MNGASDEAVTPTPNLKSWDDFFQNSNIVDCPITSCEIFDAGSCGTGSQSSAEDISMATSSPWGVLASKSNAAGY